MKEDNKTNEQYIELLYALEKQNRDYCELMESRANVLGEHIIRMGAALRKGDLRTIREMFSAYMARKPISCLGQKNLLMEKCAENDMSAYSMRERIAVYTSVFGNYDYIMEPYIKPDNVDYYVITDMDVSEASVWKKKEDNQYLQKEWEPSQKNRFVKMHPHLFFPDYEYSIYVDGNVQIVSDLTPMAKRIGECGIAAHYHSMRDCVYDELTACVLYKKLTKQEANKYRQYLEEHKMPCHYGLLMCNVLARKHNDLCKNIMEEWWREYVLHVKRDQVSLPFLLYKRKIDIKDVATLGDSVFENRLLRVERHR